MIRKRQKILHKVFRRDKIIDISGVTLTPSYKGEKCKGNGSHETWSGKLIECCCDECDYFMYCFEQEK